MTEHCTQSVCAVAVPNSMKSSRKPKIYSTAGDYLKKTPLSAMLLSVSMTLTPQSAVAQSVGGPGPPPKWR